MDKKHSVPKYQVEYLMFLVERLGIPEYLGAVLMYGAITADYSGEFKQLCFVFTDEERDSLLAMETMTNERLNADLNKLCEMGLIRNYGGVIWLNPDCFGVVPWRNLTDIRVNESYGEGKVTVEFTSKWTGNPLIKEDN